MELFEILKFSTRFFLCYFLPIRINILFHKFMCYWCLCPKLNDTVEAALTRVPQHRLFVIIIILCTWCVVFVRHIYVYLVLMLLLVVGVVMVVSHVILLLITIYLLINFSQSNNTLNFWIWFLFTTCILHKLSSYVELWHALWYEWHSVNWVGRSIFSYLALHNKLIQRTKARTSTVGKLVYVEYYLYVSLVLLMCTTSQTLIV